MPPVAGILAPIPTPFRPDDTLDEAALGRNVARWMKTPLAGLVVLGSTGEAPQLDEEESDRAIAIVRAGVPPDRLLIAGAGRESTRATIAAVRRAAAHGVDAVLVRTPGFFKPQMTADAFVAHYTCVADASPIPILLYNVSMFTGVNLAPEAVERLATHPNVIGMKESGSDMAHLDQILARTPADFPVLAGSATTLFHALCAGCHGAVLALAAALPDACVQMLALVRERRLDEARALQRRLAPLARMVGARYGVAGLKAVLDAVGFEGGPPRPPLLPVDAGARDGLQRELQGLGVLAHATH